MRKGFREIVCSAVMATAMFGSGLFTGCTFPLQQTKPTAETGIRYVNPNENISKYDSNFNHGYSLQNYPDSEDQISRSFEDLVCDSNDALAFLQQNTNLRAAGFTAVLVATSADEQGALMTYTYELYYNGFKVIAPEFRVIALTNGAVVEGPFYPLSLEMDGANKLTNPKTFLREYCNNNNDKRTYSYEGAYYLYMDTYQVSCPYVYSYRYIGDSPADNMTLMLDGNTGAFISLTADNA